MTETPAVMDNTYGKYIFCALSRYKRPISFDEILAYVARRRHVMPETIQEELTSTIEAGVQYGYLDEANNCFFQPNLLAECIQLEDIDIVRSEDITSLMSADCRSETAMPNMGQVDAYGRENGGFEGNTEDVPEEQNENAPAPADDGDYFESNYGTPDASYAINEAARRPAKRRYRKSPARRRKVVKRRRAAAPVSDEEPKSDDEDGAGGGAGVVSSDEDAQKNNDQANQPESASSIPPKSQQNQRGGQRRRR